MLGLIEKRNKRIHFQNDQEKRGETEVRRERIRREEKSKLERLDEEKRRNWDWGGQKKEKREIKVSAPR